MKLAINLDWKEAKIEDNNRNFDGKFYTINIRELNKLTICTRDIAYNVQIPQTIHDYWMEVSLTETNPNSPCLDQTPLI